MTVLIWTHNGNMETIRAFREECNARKTAFAIVHEQRDLLDDALVEGMSDEELLDDWASVSGGDDIQLFPMDVE